MKRMMGVLVAGLAMAVLAQGLSAQVARNLTGTWNLDAQTDPTTVRGPSAGLVRTAYTGSFVVAHDGSYTFTATGTVDSQAVTADGSISDIYVGFMVNGYKLGGTMPTTSFYFNGSLNAGLDTITGNFNGFAQDGTRWGGLFNLRFVPAVVNFPPVISVLPDPTGLSFTVGQTVDIAITAPDPDIEDVVTLTVSALPPGLSFTSSSGNPAVGRITGSLGMCGTFPVAFTATDSWGASSVAMVQFLVWCDPKVEADTCLAVARDISGNVTDKTTGFLKLTLRGIVPHTVGVRAVIVKPGVVSFDASTEVLTQVGNADCPGEKKWQMFPLGPGQADVRRRK